MKLEFEFVDKENIRILAIDEKTTKKNIVGQIFTPSGSGNDSKNAIQVCGFSEAFDLWGCAIFMEPAINDNDDRCLVDKNGKKIYQQAKDIQLLFSPETKAGCEMYCCCCSKCYNDPCTCEVKVRFSNPYTVKREQDLFIEKTKLEKKVEKI
jgi:hypothetical protein